jgi:porphyrinogen peroxidase
MTVPGAAAEPRALTQLLSLGLTRAAIFLVVTIAPGAEAEAAVRSLCADFSALVRAVGFRDLEGKLSCVLGVGSVAWDRLFDAPRPAELHPFREFRSGARHAPATPGDLLFHIRAERMDLCFELESQIVNRLGSSVALADEVQGFGFFDQRDLLGFVDGTENPVGEAAFDAVLIGDEDPAFASGSYVIVQKYLHDLAAWNALPTETQERIIGRSKLTNVELDAAQKPSFAHNELAKVVENGEEIKIVRDNMPFGRAGEGEFGTYFIGYARSPRTIEQMLENMFVGKPPGNYDRILDFSRAVTGNLFFAPTAAFLDAVRVEAPASEPSAAAVSETLQPSPPGHSGSLGIGSLKERPRNE